MLTWLERRIWGRGVSKEAYAMGIRHCYVFWVGSYCVIAGWGGINWQRNPFCEDEGRMHEFTWPW